jgi:(1->4)-alpha-D-glucan 1-alpha-D-glucosylmutase
VVPRSTYRVQLHAGFDFDQGARLASYLADLGISHLYGSPDLQAVTGSTHGYDVTDPTRFNPELGGRPGHGRMVQALRSAGLGYISDIVPNHMSTDEANPWWWDVLEKGPASRYARFFDIDWTADRTAPATVLVPVLADQYGRILEAGDLTVVRADDRVEVRYHDRRLPLSPPTLGGLLGAAARRAGDPDLEGVARGFAETPLAAPVTDLAAAAERDEGIHQLGAELSRLLAENPLLGQAVDEEIKDLNAEVDRLDELLRQQHYRLAYWRIASEELDYRRFFNIETLVGIRVEAPDIFAATHQLILEQVRTGTVDGLRVDHVDGLRDPEGYLTRLAEHTGGLYTVVEKILGDTEPLPDSWPVAGTTGYDFLNRVNNLWVASSHEQAMTACYVDFTGEPGDFGQVALLAKQQIMGNELRAELDHLVDRLAMICAGCRRHRDHTRRRLSDTLREVVAHFPVYRTYVQPRRLPSDVDRAHVVVATGQATAVRPDLDPELIEFIGQLALGLAGGDPGMEFAQRLQQFTAPVMAKGLEDTAFYRYHRLVSLNEVGGNPAVFGRSVETFHSETARAAARWPQSMLTLSTHDTKRSADVRARVDALSERPASWADAVARWAQINDRHRRGRWPDRNAEYLLYQTLVGAWPLEPPRAMAYMAKATKEAKVHTSWVDPDPEYDQATQEFVASILSDDAFVSDLNQFLEGERLVARGRRNALAQTALALTCPGIPDIYQGTETWELTLVDPDNRRPVDYDLRRRLLAGMRGRRPEEVARSGAGHEKLWCIYRTLQHRRHQPDLYQSSSYQPLAFSGPRSDDLVGFDRGGLAVVAPRLGDDRWDGTTVQLPAGRWTDVLTGVAHDGGREDLRELLSLFPVAVLARSL